MRLRSPGRAPRTRGGWAFLWGVFGIMTLFTTAFVVATLASSTRRITDQAMEASRARQQADAGLAMASAALERALREGRPPQPTGTLELDESTVTFTIAGDGPARFRLSATARGNATVVVRRELVAVVGALSEPSPATASTRPTQRAAPDHRPLALRTLYRR